MHGYPEAHLRNACAHLPVTVSELSRHWEREFQRDMALLGVRPPAHVQRDVHNAVAVLPEGADVVGREPVRATGGQRRGRHALLLPAGAGKAGPQAVAVRTSGGPAARCGVVA